VQFLDVCGEERLTAGDGRQPPQKARITVAFIRVVNPDCIDRGQRTLRHEQNFRPRVPAGVVAAVADYDQSFPRVPAVGQVLQPLRNRVIQRSTALRHGGGDRGSQLVRIVRKPGALRQPISHPLIENDGEELIRRVAGARQAERGNLRFPQPVPHAAAVIHEQARGHRR